MANLFVEIVSPTGNIFQGEAGGVRAPGVDGSFEVLYDHAAMISAFEVGSIRITVPSGERIEFATSGGFLEVLNNTVTILAETAELSSEIDIERAREAEEKALTSLHSAEEAGAQSRAKEDLERARNRVRIAMGSVGKNRPV